MKLFALHIIIHFVFYNFPLGQGADCFAQQQYHFKHYTTEHGLSQSSVFSIVQDEIGFMWFATEDGLNKFDGNKFTVYRPVLGDSTSLIDLGIREIYKDRSGTLWVLSLRGNICRYNPVQNSFTRFTLSADDSDNRVKVITFAEDAKNRLWVVSGKGEFFIYDKLKDKFIHKQFGQKLNSQFTSSHIQSLLGSYDGTLWIGTWKGLLHIDTELEKYEWFKSTGEKGRVIAGDMVFNLAEDKSGNIYAVSANGGLSVYLKNESQFKLFRHNPLDINSISSNRLMSIRIDKHDKIWIGTFDQGIIYYDPLNQSFYNIVHNPSIESSLSIGAVMSIYEDKCGGLWFGTNGGGVNRFDPASQNFIHYQHILGDQNSISPNPVLSICEDRDGNLYIGSDGGGLNIKEKNSTSFNSFLKNPAYGSNAITAIYEDSKDNIWVGSDPGADSPAGALIKYEKRTKSFQLVKDLTIKLGGISAILEDKHGDLWITTPSDGVHRYNPVTKNQIVYRFNPKDSTSISSNSIFSICEDSFGNLWFGSIASGLNLFDRNTNSFKRFVNDPDNENSISSNAIWCITEDYNKNLWIGTWGSGLIKYDRLKNTFSNYTIEHGLAGNIVYCIIPDNSGKLWIGSSKGLSKFNINDSSFRNYNRSDGLLINDFSAGALFKAKDGKLYFGGNSGFIVFDPQQMIENTFIPNVVITDFKVFDKTYFLPNSIAFLDKVELSYDQNFITIEFAALDFSAPEKNKFEYMLEGVDKDWVRSEGRNFASYTDLNNGEYIFKLRGSNSNGIFNTEEVVLNIIVAPPFWKTWWFRLLMLTALAILLYSIHKYRLNKLLEVERTRNKIARDLHDEVSASVTGIVYFADAIKTELKGKSYQSVSKLVNMVSESASQIQEAMSDIIWSVNPDNDSWDVVLPKFRRYASDLCDSKNITYSIDIPDIISGKTLKMEQRHDLWLVFKEIVTNAVKHSECTFIEIKLFPDSEFLYLNISDDGIGFDSSILSSNNGIKNIRSRTKALNGIADLFTAVGKGTKWNIKIPINAN